MTSTKNTNVNMIVDIGFALILALPIAITGGKIMTTSGNALEATAKCGTDVNQNEPQEHKLHQTIPGHVPRQIIP